MGLFLDSRSPYEAYRLTAAGRYFVDKTDLLAELIPALGSPERFFCITRPRRFGKSVMANMVGTFFGITADAAEIFGNLFLEYNMATSERFSEYFGFLDSEVDTLYEIYQRTAKNAKITREDLAGWYDGYHTAAGDRIYNPRSVVCALTDNQLRNYWTSSGTYDSIFGYIRDHTADVQDDLALLFSGERIPADIQEYAAASMRLSTKDEIYSAMVVYGLLTYEDGCVFIPNRELRESYAAMMKKEDFVKEHNMEKIFNVAADCKPDLHYMVNLSPRLCQMKGYVDRGEYFTVNRARQYGKTTTLRALKEYLKDEYHVISMDFQMQMSYAKFRDENTFSVAFAKAFLRIAQSLDIHMTDELERSLNALRAALTAEKEEFELVELFQFLSEICRASDKPLVLMIDETDSAANNQVFLDFLSQLRGYYIDRDQTPTFQSVILAGVYDIKNLKNKFLPGKKHLTNSPWNIAVDFKIDMSFSPEEIAEMLKSYEKDHAVGMDIHTIAELIYAHTSGYPFLVSKLCKLIDEEVAGSAYFPDKKAAWTYAGFLEADKILLAEKNTLFESMVNKLYDFPELKDIVCSILFTGKEFSYNALDQATETAEMFGFIKNVNGTIAIANRTFEMVFYNLFLTSAENQNTDIYKAAIQDKNQFIYAGHLNMDLLLEKFVAHFNDLYGELPDKFKEEDGRRYFLLYLRPIINGAGNYYVESRTRNMERTDVIIDYRGEQIIVELKIWRGNAYHERGEKQLTDYLDHYHLKKGYMLSFNFNQNKKIGISRVILGDKVLIEAVV